MRRLVSLLALLASADAAAKGLAGVTVCDRGACAAAGPADVRIFDGGLRFHPAAGVLRTAGGRWYRPGAATVRALRTGVRALEAPPPSLLGLVWRWLAAT